MEQNFQIVIQDLANVAGSYRAMLEQIAGHKEDLELPTSRLDETYRDRIDDESLKPKEGTLGMELAEKLKEQHQDQRLDFTRLQDLQSKTPEIMSYMQSMLTATKDLNLSELEIPEKLELKLTELEFQEKMEWELQYPDLAHKLLELKPSDMKLAQRQMDFPELQQQQRPFEIEYSAPEYEKSIEFPESEVLDRFNWPESDISPIQEVKQEQYAELESKNRQSMELAETLGWEPVPMEWTPQESSFKEALYANLQETDYQGVNLAEIGQNESKKVQLSQLPEIKSEFDLSPLPEEKSPQVNKQEYNWADEQRKWKIKEWEEGWGKIDIAKSGEPGVGSVNLSPKDEIDVRAIPIATSPEIATSSPELASTLPQQEINIGLNREEVEPKPIELSQLMGDLKDVSYGEYQQEQKEIEYPEHFEEFGTKEIPQTPLEEFSGKHDISEPIIPEAREIILEDLMDIKPLDLNILTEFEAPSINIDTSYQVETREVNLTQREEKLWKWESADYYNRDSTFVRMGPELNIGDPRLYNNNSEHISWGID